ncbi:MAG: nucleotidyltransferase domain-containing protein [candidate division NC10 bacterium]|nr:nucleotidyltransferase domain-containing protein [candidate division NC10 bacterium]MDE2322837.1 nucleotidyltransferase domain-containing protein [candidate division NC10 bacterium]
MMDVLNRRLRDLAEAFAQGLRADLGDDVISVVLFGSVARGEANPYSDVDLFVVVRNLPRGRRARLERVRAADQRIEKRLKELRGKEIYSDVCPILQTPEEAVPLRPFYLDFVEDAVILFDPDGFFASVLDRLKSRLKELRSVRRRMGKTRYWDLKPDLRPGEIFEL